MASGWARPQLRHAMPVMRGGATASVARGVAAVATDLVGVSRVTGISGLGVDRRRGDRMGWDDPDRFEGAPKSSLISQEDLPGVGTLPASRR